MGIIYFIIGLAFYGIFFATFLYLIGFVGNLQELIPALSSVLPKTIDTGVEGSLLGSIIINLLLLSVFAVQHSVMARQGFKKAWTKIIPQPLERSVYVLAASLALMLIFSLLRIFKTKVIYNSSNYLLTVTLFPQLIFA